ncbi:hypothetical protein O9H32_04920 [Paenibacillus mucilaginosus]|nr:hypothetical protein [Paenibacillus caseinilyticus]
MEEHDGGGKQSVRVVLDLGGLFREEEREDGIEVRGGILYH